MNDIKCDNLVIGWLFVREQYGMTLNVGDTIHTTCGIQLII